MYTKETDYSSTANIKLIKSNELYFHKKYTKFIADRLDDINSVIPGIIDLKGFKEEFVYKGIKLPAILYTKEEILKINKDFGFNITDNLVWFIE